MGIYNSNEKALPSSGQLVTRRVATNLGCADCVIARRAFISIENQPPQYVKEGTLCFIIMMFGYLNYTREKTKFAG